MAPAEKPVCDVLADNLDLKWEDKALHMLDIVINYQCMNNFFDKIELSPEQIESIKRKKRIEESETVALPQSL